MFSFFKPFGKKFASGRRQLPPRRQRERLRGRLSLEPLEERLTLNGDMTSIPYVAHASPTMLGVNFDGENSYVEGGATLGGANFFGKSIKVNSYDNGTAKIDQNIQDILFRLSEIYAPFNVEVTRVLGNGTYFTGNGQQGATTVFAGSSYGDVNIGAGATPDEFTDYPSQGQYLLSQIAGTPQTSRDSGQYHLAFVDPTKISNNWLVAKTIAHESGHTFGLAHVRTDGQTDPSGLTGQNNPPDIMSYNNPANNGLMGYFADQALNLTAYNYDPNSNQNVLQSGSWPDYYNLEPSTQNSYQSLLQVLGNSPWSSPSHVADVGAIDYQHQSQFVKSTDNLVSDGSIIGTFGTISRLGQYDVYRWTAPTTETLSSSTVTGKNGLNPVLLMYQADGALQWQPGVSKPTSSTDQVKTDSGNTLLYSYDSRSGAVGSLNVAKGTSYYFVVGAQDSDSTGDYTLTLHQLPSWAQWSLNGGLTVNGNQLGTPLEVLNISLDALGRTVVNLNGEKAIFGSGQLSGGIWVNSLAVPIPYFNPVSIVGIQECNCDITVSASSIQTLTLGNNGSLANINGTISVNCPTSLVIDDSADGNGNGFTLTNNGYNESYVNFGNAYVFYSSNDAISVKGGPGQNRFDVESTAAPLTLYTGTGINNSVHVAGASRAVNIVDQAATTGIDTVKVGTNGDLTGITAAVTISQPPGSKAAIALYIDDAWDASTRTIIITTSKVTFSGLPTSINFQGVTLSSLLIEDPWYENNTIDLESLPTGINGVTIYTNGTHDTRTGPLWYDIWFTYPPNWGSVIPLPSNLQLFNVGQNNSLGTVS